MKNGFAESPLRHSMKLVELGARFMDFVDLEFSELRCLAGKNGVEPFFLNLELFGALPNTPKAACGRRLRLRFTSSM
jgi:hypothetical protein